MLDEPLTQDVHSNWILGIEAKETDLSDYIKVETTSRKPRRTLGDFIPPPGLKPPLMTSSKFGALTASKCPEPLTSRFTKMKQVEIII